MGAGGCTWVGCQEMNGAPQLTKTGEQWACLCPMHESMLTRACDTSAPTWNPKTVVGVWIKAQGGPEAAARRAFGKYS